MNRVAAIFVGDDRIGTIPLEDSEVRGFQKGFQACQKAAGGSAETVSYYILPDEEDEMKAHHPA